MFALGEIQIKYALDAISRSVSKRAPTGPCQFDILNHA